MDKVGQGVLLLGPKLKFGGLMDKSGFQTKAHVSLSVKGKKVIARSRALTQLNKAASSSKPLFTSASQVHSFLDNNGVYASSLFQFSAAPLAKLGNQCRGEVEIAPHAELGNQCQGKLTHSTPRDGDSRN